MARVSCTNNRAKQNRSILGLFSTLNGKLLRHPILNYQVPVIQTKQQNFSPSQSIVSFLVLTLDKKGNVRAFHLSEVKWLLRGNFCWKQLILVVSGNCGGLIRKKKIYQIFCSLSSLWIPLTFFDITFFFISFCNSTLKTEFVPQGKKTRCVTRSNNSCNLKDATLFSLSKC